MKQLAVNTKAFIGTGRIYGLSSFAQELGSAANGVIDIEGAANVNPAALTDDLYQSTESANSGWLFPNQLGSDSRW